MIVKAVEVRDKHTFIPAIAIRMVAASEAQRYLMARLGFRGGGVMLVHIARGRATADPYEWGSRTMKAAHLWIDKNFDTMQDGEVVDVEFILGETPAPKLSERLTIPDI